MPSTAQDAAEEPLHLQRLPRRATSPAAADIPADSCATNRSAATTPDKMDSVQRDYIQTDTTPANSRNFESNEDSAQIDDEKIGFSPIRKVYSYKDLDNLTEYTHPDDLVLYDDDDFEMCQPNELVSGPDYGSDYEDLYDEEGDYSALYAESLPSPSSRRMSVSSCRSSDEDTDEFDDENDVIRAKMHCWTCGRTYFVEYKTEDERLAGRREHEENHLRLDGEIRSNNCYGFNHCTSREQYGEC